MQEHLLRPRYFASCGIFAYLIASVHIGFLVLVIVRYDWVYFLPVEPAAGMMLLPVLLAPCAG